MDAHVDEGRADARANTPERLARSEIRPPRVGGTPELRWVQEFPVALARERAE